MVRRLSDLVFARAFADPAFPLNRLEAHPSLKPHGAYWSTLQNQRRPVGLTEVLLAGIERKVRRAERGASPSGSGPRWPTPIDVSCAE